MFDAKNGSLHFFGGASWGIIQFLLKPKFFAESLIFWEISKYLCTGDGCSATLVSLFQVGLEGLCFTFQTQTPL